MFLPRWSSVVRQFAAVVLIGVLPTALGAQQSAASQPATPQPVQRELVHQPDYSVPRSAFPRILHPYTARPVTEPNLGNSPRIDSLMHDGKVYLSIDDAVAPNLSDNLAIAADEALRIFICIPVPLNQIAIATRAHGAVIRVHDQIPFLDGTQILISTIQHSAQSFIAVKLLCRNVENTNPNLGIFENGAK